MSISDQEFQRWLGVGLEDNTSVYPEICDGQLLANVKVPSNVEVSFADHYCDGIEAADEADKLLDQSCNFHAELLTQLLRNPPGDTDCTSEQVACENLELIALMSKHGMSMESIGSHLAKTHSTYGTTAALGVHTVAAVANIVGNAGTGTGIIVAVALIPILKVNLALFTALTGYLAKACLQVGRDGGILRDEALEVSAKVMQHTEPARNTIMSAQIGVLKVGGYFPKDSDIIATAEYVELVTRTLLTNPANNLASKFLGTITKSLHDIASGKVVDTGKLISDIQRASDAELSTRRHILSIGNTGESKELCGGYAIHLTQTVKDGVTIGGVEYKRHTGNKISRAFGNVEVPVADPKTIIQSCKALASMGSNMSKYQEDIKVLYEDMGQFNAALQSAIDKVKSVRNRKMEHDLAVLATTAGLLVHRASKTDMAVSKHSLFIGFHLLTYLNRSANKYD